jgi:cysteinyl-tRNA synthetase
MVERLKLYNTLTRQKALFAPLDPNRVGMYACGPTVYDQLHIGNGRMLIVFDLIFRVLRELFGSDHVTYVRNITDVDDKINARAAERGVEIGVLTEEMVTIFHRDAEALGCLAPTIEPRATGHIGEMIMMITRLIERGHAYVADGHVLFSVTAMAGYGRLSRRSTDEMLAGARIDIAPYKRDPMDFVLWKPAPAPTPGWPSPWGRGRPGWHIECSAMSWKHLGEVFDLHGGGIDLLFPHHENERAQTCCAFGHPEMATVWLHNGHLQVEGEKMSKSLGNFLTISELWGADSFGGRRWDGAVLRLAILRSHYRQPMDFTVRALEEAERTLQSWAQLAPAPGPKNAPPDSVMAALCDDFNTPLAITEMHRLALAARQGEDGARGLSDAASLIGIDLWRLQADYAAQRATPIAEPEAVAAIDRLVEARNAARLAKNWGESDRIRAELAARGVLVKDRPDGTTHWEFAENEGR